MEITSTKWRDMLWAFAPLFFWIGVIFFLSSGSGSSAETSRIIRPLLEWFFPSANASTLDQYHLYICKLAHLTEYAILGLLACRAYRNAFDLGRVALAIAAAATVLVIASADEFNQSFNPMRTSSPTDIALDVTGGVIAIVFFAAVARKRIATS